MKAQSILLMGLLWLLVLTAPCIAKSWNNITPIKTTRAEILTRLGQPQLSKDGGREYFDIENDRVSFLWIMPDCYVGKSLLIDEKSAGPLALVYKIIVQPSDPRLGKYDEEIRELLAMMGAADCVGAQLGACGAHNFNVGLGYNRDARGIKRIEYFAPIDEEMKWRQNLKPCAADCSTTPTTSEKP